MCKKNLHSFYTWVSEFLLAHSTTDKRSDNSNNRIVMIVGKHTIYYYESTVIINFKIRYTIHEWAVPNTLIIMTMITTKDALMSSMQIFSFCCLKVEFQMTEMTKKIAKHVFFLVVLVNTFKKKKCLTTTRRIFSHSHLNCLV